MRSIKHFNSSNNDINLCLGTSRLINFSGLDAGAAAEQVDIRSKLKLTELSQGAQDLLSATSNPFNVALDALNTYIGEFTDQASPAAKKFREKLTGEASEKILRLKAEYKKKIGEVGVEDESAKEAAKVFGERVRDFVSQLKARYETPESELKYTEFLEEKDQVKKTEMLSGMVKDLLKAELGKIPENTFGEAGQEELARAIAETQLSTFGRMKSFKEFQGSLQNLLTQENGVVAQAIRKMSDKLPKIEATSNEKKVIKQVLGTDVLKEKYGTQDTDAMAEIIGRELEITFDKKGVAIGYVEMMTVGANGSLTENTNYEVQPCDPNQLIAKITELCDYQFKGKTPEKLKKINDSLSASSRKLIETRTDVSEDTAEWGDDDINSLKTLADPDNEQSGALVKMAKLSAEFRNSRQEAEALAAARTEVGPAIATITVPESASPEMTARITALKEQLASPMNIKNNPAIRDGNILKQIVLLIQAMMGNKDALKELSGGLDRNENPDAKRKEALAKYGEILAKVEPKPTLKELLDWHGASELPTKLKAGQTPETVALLENYKTTRAEAMRAYIGKQLGSGIEVTTIENGIMTLKKENVSLKVKLEASGDRLMAKQVDAAQGIEATDVTSGASEFVANLFKPKDVENATDASPDAILKASYKAKLNGLVSDPKQLQLIAEAISRIKGVKGAPEWAKTKAAGDKTRQTVINEARVAWIVDIDVNFKAFKTLVEKTTGPKALAKLLEPFKQPEVVATAPTQVDAQSAVVPGQQRAAEPPPVEPPTAERREATLPMPEYPLEVNRIFDQLKMGVVQLRNEPQQGGGEMGNMMGSERTQPSTDPENLVRDSFRSTLINKINAIGRLGLNLSEPIPGLDTKIKVIANTDHSVLTASIDIKDRETIIAVKNFIKSKVPPVVATR